MRSAGRRGGSTLARLIALLALIAASAASSAAEARGKADPPDELIVSVALGPVTTLRSLQAYIEAVQPGAGAPLTDQVVRRGLAGLVGASSLDGFDPASSTYLLVASLDDTPAFALLGKVADAKAVAASAGDTPTMIKGGWAVIGARPVLDKIGPYALAAIAPQPAPRAPTATLYLPALLARYRTQIEAFRAQMIVTMAASNPGPMNQMMTGYLDALGSLGTDSDKLVVTLEATPEIAWFDLALAPRPGSRLARFAALQRPTDYALLDRLPDSPASIVLAGHLELGPYRDGFLTFMSAIYGPDASRDLMAALDAARKAMTGDIAMAIRFAPGAGMAFTQLYGTADPAAAEKAMIAILDLFKAGRSVTFSHVSSTIQASAGTTPHDGVALRSYDTTYDLANVPAAEREAVKSVVPTGTHRGYLGTFDKLTMMVVAPDSLAEAGRTIDAARGKAPHFVASPAIGTLIDAARARKDSLAAVVDLGGFVALVTGGKAADLPFLMSFGFADRNAHLRLALPAATLTGTMKLAKP